MSHPGDRKHRGIPFWPLLAILLAACGDAPPAEPTAGSAAEPVPATDVADHLVALGYAAWDENADLELSGVVRHEGERVAPGANLYTNDVDTVILMDSEGQVLREWKLPGRRHCEHVEPIAGPRLAVLCQGEMLVVLESSGEVVFQVRANVHHDVAQRPDGSLLVIAREGFRFHRGRNVEFDALLEVTADGSKRKVWSGSEAVDGLRALHGPTELDEWVSPLALARYAFDRLRRSVTKHEYYHMNSVEVIAENRLGSVDPRFRSGNILLGLRNANTAVVLDAEDWQPVWHWGERDLELPHMPTLLDKGTMLIFDNGTHRGWTRILELDPREKRIVWQHTAEPDPGFFSAWRGSSQRLPNGNTLICLSTDGRVIEVDPRGEIVWDFWNPELRNGRRKGIYRFQRIPPELAQLLVGAAPEGSRAPAEG